MNPTPEMIEAAARAIAVSMDTDPDNDAFDGIPMWNKFVPEAKAAIKAAFAAMWRPISEAPEKEVVMGKGGGLSFPVAVFHSGELEDPWLVENHQGDIEPPKFFAPLSIFKDSK